MSVLDPDQFIFDWFNNLFPDEMAACLRAFEQRVRDRDGAEGGDEMAAPVPQDRQARAEGIAQTPDNPKDFA